MARVTSADPTGGTLLLVRALLIVNPMATATSPRGRDVLVRALGSDLKLDVAETRHRAHAVELARQAVADEVELVVTLGGDGTVNEVVNGLLADGPGSGVPALAVVPGGSTNVFARTLGLSRDPVEATSELLDALREGRRRTLGLGRTDDRWFTFCAGMGLDAEVVREVERRRGSGANGTPMLYVRTAVRTFFTGTDRRHPALRLSWPGGEPVDDLFLGIVSNSTPWTYVGARPVQPTPRASFHTGLELLALRRIRTLTALRVVRRMTMRGAAPPRGRSVVTVSDAAELTLTADRPVAVQVDGDYVGERKSVRFRSVPDALTVIA